MRFPKQNRLLAALSAADYARLLPDLELVPMPLGWSVYESGKKMSHVYFPTTCIVSLLYVMENGTSAEIAVTGNCGLVGISLFMGGREHAEPGRGTKCGQQFSAQSEYSKKGIRTR